MLTKIFNEHSIQKKMIKTQEFGDNVVALIAVNILRRQLPFGENR